MTKYSGESGSLSGGTPDKLKPVRVKKSQERDSKANVLAERLRAARLAAHLTQQQLAGKRFSKSYVSAIERGKMIPSFQALTYLAEMLAVPRSYLLGESDIDGHTLEESSSGMFAAAALDSQIDEEEALRRLGLAETFIHQDRPEEAWEQLGARNEPPAGWPLLLRPHWTWLAGWTLTLLGRPAEAVSCLEAGLDQSRTLRLRAPLAKQVNWDEMIAWLHCLLGVAHCAQGHTPQALQFYLCGLEAIVGGKVGNAELKLLIYKGLGNEYFGLVDYQQAIGYYQKALLEVENCNNQRQHGLAAWGLARAYQMQGDLFHAKMYYQQALQALGEYGNRRLIARIRAVYGLALVSFNDYEEAERQLQKSLDGATQIGNAGTCAMALAYFASLHNARGNPDQAIQAAQGSLPLAQESGDGRAEGHALFTLADAYTAKQDWAAVEQTYEEIIRLAKRLPDYDMLSQASQDLADFLAKQARFQEAYQALVFVNPSIPEFAGVP